MSICWRNVLIAVGIVGVVATTVCLAVYGNGNMEGKDWIQALATLVAGALIPFAYYYMIVHPQNRNDALRKMLTAELEDVMRDVLNTYHAMQDDPVQYYSSALRTMRVVLTRLVALSTYMKNDSGIDKRIPKLLDEIHKHAVWIKDVIYRYDPNEDQIMLKTVVGIDVGHITMRASYIELLLLLNGYGTKRTPSVGDQDIEARQDKSINTGKGASS